MDKAATGLIGFIAVARAGASTDAPPPAMRIATAEGFWQRFFGLMFRRPPPAPGRGLLLLRCTSIHTCFMRYALDIAWLDGQGNVVGIVRHLKPWRARIGPRSARHVLELAADDTAGRDLKVGDHIDHPHLSGGG